MDALVKLIIGLAFAALYVNYHPSKEAGDIGREYIAVSQALADAKLPADARAVLELRRDAVAAAIRSSYNERLDFNLHNTHPMVAGKKAAPEREYQVSALTLGKFTDYDWTVTHSKDVSVEADPTDATKGVVRFTVDQSHEETGHAVTATLKTDKGIEKASLLMPND